MSNFKESANLWIKGSLKIKNMKTGQILLSKNNLVVNNAKTIIASALVGDPSSDFISYISIGDDSTAPVISNAALGNQVHQVDCSFESEPTPYFQDQTESDDSITKASTVIFSGIVDEDVEFTASEAGLFSRNEFMFSRIIFDEIQKTTGSPWLVSWKLIIGL